MTWSTEKWLDDSCGLSLGSPQSEESDGHGTQRRFGLCMQWVVKACFRVVLFPEIQGAPAKYPKNCVGKIRMQRKKIQTPRT